MWLRWASAEVAGSQALGSVSSRQRNKAAGLSPTPTGHLSQELRERTLSAPVVLRSSLSRAEGSLCTGPVWAVGGRDAHGSREGPSGLGRARPVPTQSFCSTRERPLLVSRDLGSHFLLKLSVSTRAGL